MLVLELWEMIPKVLELRKMIPKYNHLTSELSWPQPHRMCHLAHVVDVIDIGVQLIFAVLLMFITILPGIKGIQFILSVYEWLIFCHKNMLI